MAEGGPLAVLDASALVALLFKEQGHETIVRIIRAGAVTTATGLAEALDVARRRNHGLSSAELLDALGELGLEVEPLDLPDGLAMADLLALAEAKRKQQPGIGSLSLGDAACLAVAQRLELPAVFSDGTWEVLDLPIQLLPFR